MPDNYFLLERIELNASAASVTFSNIPQSGYTDLKVVFSGRNSVNSTGLAINFNGNTSGYSYRRLWADGSSANSGSGSSLTLMEGILGLSQNNYTASTFGNVEVYIPNYTSSTNKSVSIDAVTENNATGSFTELYAGLWSNSAAITSILFTPADSGNFVANSTFSLYGLAALGTTPVIAPKASGGNIIDFDGTYWIHTFLTSGTFTPATALSCQYLVVAGGGGGGGDYAGGGAGGYRNAVTGETSGGGSSAESALSVASGNAIAITVGAGGAGGLITSPRYGFKGSDSTFSTITSVGGGGGNGNPSVSTNSPNGGSGGGGSTNAGASTSGGTATTNQGYAGGSGVIGASYPSGGGGGAGAVGENGSGTTGGNGGNGLASSITSTSVTRAGGGGGTAEGTATSGSGGSGGGGAAGASGGNNAGIAGTVNTGSGGGGGHYQTAYAAGGAGGSGIVIIRYLAA
jgi:hypothetical protein